MEAFVGGVEPGAFELGNVLSCFYACGALCCIAFVRQDFGGNALGIAMILGLHRSHRGQKKIKLCLNDVKVWI